MDSSRKRKASDAATPASSHGVASKKIKLLNTQRVSRTESLPNEVQQVGDKLLVLLHNAQDKTGRAIADAFLVLPPSAELPDYYDIIKLPIALDIVEDNLRRNAYPTITALESDLKRMVQNAKDYNQPRSEVYEDAERIRKLVYNFMKIHNPQYRLDPNYVSFPTPVPGENTPGTNGTHEEEEPIKSIGTKHAVAPKTSEPLSERKSSRAPSATTGVGDDDDDEGEDDVDFNGKSYQEAQQMIVSGLIRYIDEEGLEIFTPFVNLPSRKLEDYYRVIRHPVSLKSVQKRIQGQHGRAPLTGVTDFKTWDAFEEEVSYIWRNATEYNEDGSEMFELAGDFQKLFKTRLDEAKQKVEEPTGPRIKIGASKPKSGITLNLSQHRPSPVNGVSVDNEALARQRQMVQAGANGQPADQRPTPPTNILRKSSSLGPAVDAVQPDGRDETRSPASIAIKSEKQPVPSPAPELPLAVRPMSNGAMAPPIARPPSGSPYPQVQQQQQPIATAGSYSYYTAPALLPPTAVRAYPKDQALLPLVTISTHPHLKIPKPYSLAIPPHVSLSQQSTTITLPPSHYYLQVSPTVSHELSMGRAYKMFVSINGSRLTQRDTHFHSATGTRSHVYEGSLVPGVNRIEVEIAAAKVDAQGNASESGLDVEKVTVFASLMR